MVMMLIVIVIIMFLPLEELVSIGFNVEAAVGFRNEGVALAFVMLGNIDAIILVVVVAVIVIMVTATVVVAVIIVVLLVVLAEDENGTVLMNLVALVETDVVEVVAPARSTAVVTLANNQDGKVAPMVPIARIEWVEVLTLGDASASGCGGVVAATSVINLVVGPYVAGAKHVNAVAAVNNWTSDGQADREGEGGNNGGETHDD